ncbi:WapI family immunity protein [Alkaliphilus crotonatoxidans]
MNEDNIIFDSNGKKLAIEHLYTVENYFTFNIKVESGEFTGASHFCISKENILVIVEALSKMHETLSGCSKISDSDSDAYINLEMDKSGHISMAGQIGGSHEEHNMKFKYTTDQTILSGLIQKLKSNL